MSVRLLVQQCTAASLRLPSEEILQIGRGMVVFVCFNKVEKKDNVFCKTNGREAHSEFVAPRPFFVLS
jgi:hypothetical protein